MRNSSRPFLVLFVLFGPCGVVTLCQAQFPTPTVEFAPTTGGTVTVPVRNGLDMPVSLNGQPPVDVLFDTGTDTLLSTNLARRLGLKLSGNVALGGFGSGSRAAATAVVDTVQIGGLILHGVTFIVVDPPIAGSDEFAVLGVPLLSQVVTTVDYVRHRITFTDPQQFHYKGSVPPVPLNVQGNSVTIPGKIDGTASTLQIDTGDVWSMEVVSAFVKQHDLVQRYAATLHGYAGSGFGGDDTAFYTRVHTLELGFSEVHEPVAFLSTDVAGMAADSPFAANIGTHILRQFTLIFDAPYQALYLEKSALYGQPDVFNRAGLMLDGDHDGLIVHTVLPGSPAATAGITEGDQILAINGRSVKQPKGTAAMSEAVGIDAFARPVGTTLELKVRHGKSVGTVILKLKEIL
jgi:hypothetical protein